LTQRKTKHQITKKDFGDDDDDNNDDVAKRGGGVGGGKKGGATKKKLYGKGSSRGVKRASSVHTSKDDDDFHSTNNNAYIIGVRQSLERWESNRSNSRTRAWRNINGNVPKAGANNSCSFTSKDRSADHRFIFFVGFELAGLPFDLPGPDRRLRFFDVRA